VRWKVSRVMFTDLTSLRSYVSNRDSGDLQSLLYKSLLGCLGGLEGISIPVVVRSCWYDVGTRQRCGVVDVRWWC